MFTKDKIAFQTLGCDSWVLLSAKNDKKVTMPKDDEPEQENET